MMSIFRDSVEDNHQMQYNDRPASIQTVDPVIGQLVVL